MVNFIDLLGERLSNITRIFYKHVFAALHHPLRLGFDIPDDLVSIFSLFTERRSCGPSWILSRRRLKT